MNSCEDDGALCRQWVFAKLSRCLSYGAGCVSGVLLVGASGTGKSAICRQLTQTGRAHCVLASYFCPLARPAAGRARHFANSLAGQLRQLALSEGLSVDLLPGGSVWAVCQWCVSLLARLPAPGKCVFLLVDGLERDRGGAVTQLVCRLQRQLPPWLLLLLSTRRHDNDTIQLFKGFRKIVLDDVNKPHVLRDLQQRVISRVQRDVTLADRLHQNSHHCLRKLQIKSDGCLLYLDKVMSSVSAGLISADELETIPGTLFGLYLWLSSKSLNRRRFHKARPVLNILLAARKPLADAVLFHCMCLKNAAVVRQDFERRLHVLRPFITQESTEEERVEAGLQSVGWRLFHNSFGEWLTQLKYCTDRFLCDTTDGHGILACWMLRQGPELSPEQVEELVCHLAVSRDWCCQEPPLCAGEACADSDAYEVAMLLLWSAVSVDVTSQPAEKAHGSRCLLSVANSIALSACPPTALSPDFCADDGLTVLLQFSVDHGAAALSESSASALSASADIPSHDAPAEPPPQPPPLPQTVECTDTVSCAAARQRLSQSCQVGRESDDTDRSSTASSLQDVASFEGSPELSESDCPAVYEEPPSNCRVLEVGGDAGLRHPDVGGGDAEAGGLMSVALAGEVEDVERMLASGADVRLEDGEGRNMLTLTVMAASPCLQTLRLLLERGAQANHSDRAGVTPLLIAAFLGHREVCQLLLQFGADADHKDGQGRCPLFAAASMGHTQVVRLLADSGCYLNTIDAQGRTVLCLAAAQGAVDTMRLLLQHGLDDSHRDNAGWTPLHHAAFEGQRLAVQTLVEFGADLNEVDNRGRHALALACREGHLSTAAELLAHGAQPNLVSHEGSSCLREAAWQEHAGLVQLLAAAGAELSPRDRQQRSLLYLLALHGRLHMTRLLCRLGADLEARDSQGRTALHVSCWQGSLQMALVLLEAGADVNCEDSDGCTPLISAAWQGHSQLLALLLSRGARVEHACRQDATALCISAQEGFLESVAVLLAHAADARREDALGRSAVKVALKAGHLPVVRLLLHYGASLSTDDTLLLSELERAAENDSCDSDSGHMVPGVDRLKLAARSVSEGDSGPHHCCDNDKVGLSTVECCYRS